MLFAFEIFEIDQKSRKLAFGVTNPLKVCDFEEFPKNQENTLYFP